MDDVLDLLARQLRNNYTMGISETDARMLIQSAFAAGWSQGYNDAMDEAGAW